MGCVDRWNLNVLSKELLLDFGYTKTEECVVFR